MKLEQLSVLLRGLVTTGGRAMKETTENTKSTENMKVEQLSVVEG